MIPDSEIFNLKKFYLVPMKNRPKRMSFSEQKTNFVNEITNYMVKIL